MVDIQHGESLMKLRNIGTKLETLEFYSKVSPVDSENIYQVPLSRNLEIVDVFNNASTRKKNLENEGVFGRSVILENVIGRLIEKRSEIVNLVIKETGKSRRLSEGEFDAAILFGKSLLGLARFQDDITIPSTNPKKLVYEKRIPFGIAGLIVSYNTPMPNYAWKVFPSFLSGNISILKPSPHTSGSAQLFAEAFESEDVPEFSVCLIHGDGETGKILCNQDLDLMSFTGSYDVGIEIQKSTSPKMRKNIFELGGNNCLIINKSANLYKAVDEILNSAFSNAGQRCAAGSRVILNKEIADSTLKIIKEKLSNLKVGSDEDSFLGPVIDVSAASRYNEFLAACKANNLTISKSDTHTNLNELYLYPALVEGFDEKNPLFAKELFAPILRVAIFESREEALNLANNSKYALTAAVWSNELEEIDFYLNNLSAGLININGPTHGAEFQFPFGGIGHSGNGSKEVGVQCLDQYSHHKLVTITHHG